MIKDAFPGISRWVARAAPLRPALPRKIRPPFPYPISWRYSVAVLLAIVGFLIRLLLHPVMGVDTPILLSIIAVALAAWIGGFGPGAVATFVSFLGAIALLTWPFGAPIDMTTSQVLRLLLFLMTGLIVSGLTEALYQTTGAWMRAEQEQENRVLQERNRMAREIHDTLAQGLTGIIIQLEAADDTLPDAPGQAHAHIVRAQDLARHSLTEARRSVQALRPQALEERDLPGALALYAEQMTAGSGVKAEVIAQGVPPPFLTSEIQSNLLRIGVEALTNALKHARADTVQIALTFTEDQVSLTIRDNGRGFVPHSPQGGAGFGLTGMWERAERMGAQFHLTSLHGEGTEITVRLTPQREKSEGIWSVR